MNILLISLGQIYFVSRYIYVYVYFFGDTSTDPIYKYKYIYIYSFTNIFCNKILRQTFPAYTKVKQTTDKKLYLYILENPLICLGTIFFLYSYVLTSMYTSSQTHECSTTQLFSHTVHFNSSTPTTVVTLQDTHPWQKLLPI